MKEEKIIFHHHIIDKIAIYAGVFSGIALYPQVYIIITTKNIDGLSLLSFIIIFINSFVWTLYAIHRHLIALIVSSLLNLLASIILILLILFN